MRPRLALDRDALPRVVLVVLTLAVIAAGIVAARAWSERPTDVRDRAPRSASSEDGYRVGTLPDRLDEAVEAAATTLPLALSYDYRSLEPGVAAATAGMTDTFAADYRRTFTGSAARLARQERAVTNAVVRAAGLVRTEGSDRALCLVYLDQTLVSSRTTEAKKDRTPTQVAQNRVLVGVRLVDGRWLVDSISPF
ncbi:hypothetical protein GCM10022215_15640 [Nocardioides fonticola]|uniref:Mce-associated membrane protein n=1 Tax=Nocardioides fonticola TaxID=450363 RepID=A0ABP7XGW6_9ACTN